MPGYAGGHLKNPSYDQVCSGTSGHAESLQIEFDPMQISFEKILNIFWHTHNPTTLNQQGNDVGSQYRSAIFYHNKIQKELAEKSKVQIEKEGAYTDPIVTEITPYINFYAAENYHKDYFDKNREAPYCNIIISPKIKKLLEIYSNDIKEEYKQ